jgi:hypothetical protein
VHFFAIFAESFAYFAVKDFERKDHKDSAKAAKQGGTPVTTGRDQQSSKHWRHIASTAYNPAATFFFLN